MINSLPVLYFKTTVVCLDDNKEFIDSFQILLGDMFNVVTFESNLELEEYIKSYKSLIINDGFLRVIHDTDISDNNFCSLIEFNLSNIFKIINDECKYNEISTLIVDYFMPGKNGIEVCKDLQNYVFRKLLITGNKDYTIGINAINAGLIHKYVEKNTDPIKTRDIILRLSYLYFEKITSNFRSLLEIEHRLPLSDGNFIKFFLSFMEDNKIVEYYLIDKNGSLIMIDINNKRSLLIVHTDRSLNEFITTFSDFNKLNLYIEQINSRTLLPWFGIGVNNFDVTKKIESYLYPTLNKIDGSEVYYLAHIES